MFALFRRPLPLRRVLLLQCHHQHTTSTSVSIFWDLNMKAAKSLAPYDAAVRLHLAAATFGRIQFSIAYTKHHAFKHRQDGKATHALFICHVCGRNFFERYKLLRHFKQIHEAEQEKRQRRMELATGGRKVRIASKLSLRMEKFRKAARELFVPDVGFSFGEDLRRAGVVVRMVEDCPEAATQTLRQHMMDTMCKGNVGFLMLVSDDPRYCEVLREARMRCLKTIVVGEEGDGALKRLGSIVLSWKDVISGKTKEALSVVAKWKDRKLLERLEWRYEQEKEEKDGDFEEFEGESEEDSKGKGKSKPWWKLD